METCSNAKAMPGYGLLYGNHHTRKAMLTSDQRLFGDNSQKVTTVTSA